MLCRVVVLCVVVLTILQGMVYSRPASKDDVSAEAGDICGLPAMKGHCRALLPRWRYDAKSKKCVEFNFGGCDGNSNNFKSEKECLSTCAGF